MEATCLGGVHHVTDQVDLSSQMLNSRESTMTIKERRRGKSQTDNHSSGSSPGLEGWTPLEWPQLWPRHPGDWLLSRPWFPALPSSVLCLVQTG